MKTLLRSYETDLLLRAVMPQRCLTTRDLAESTGYTHQTMSLAFSTSFKVEMMRWKVEAALRYEVPIWSTPSVLSLRKKLVETLGCDPFLLSRPQLLKLAKMAGLKGFQLAEMRVIRDALMAHYAVNPVSKQIVL